MTDQNAATPAVDPNAPVVTPQVVYLKDCSFESPNGPFVGGLEGQPAVNLNISTRATAIAQDLHEVVVQVHLEAKAGDKVVMWYISANRDESVFPDAGRFDVRRENARRHLSFGHGVHRCVGARLAEIQLATLIGEIVERNWTVSLAAEPKRLASCFLHGFTEMPVSISI